MASELTDDEAQHIIELKEQAARASGRQLRHLRRVIRNRIFRIRQGRDGFDNGLKKFIEAQLSPDQSLDTFTFNWDIAPNDPMKVVSPYEWTDCGGTFETVMVLCQDGITRPERQCDPTAFTKQE